MRLRSIGVGYLIGAALFPRVASADVELGEVEDIESLSLHDLLEQPVTSASLYAQKPGSSPIVVSTVDADLISTFGYRTLGEALRGLRGVYTSNDRNYSYLGARGISVPGDYNTRYALTIDNHNVNDIVYQQGHTGAELGLPMIAIDRIEMIRGGAWSVHGESALLGAVQIVTASGATKPGIHVQTTARATAETFQDPAGRGRVEPRGQDVAASYGVVRNGYDVFVASQYSYDPGLSAIYMPELAVTDEPCVGLDKKPTPCNGVIHGNDGEETGSLYAAIKKRGFAFRGLASSRRKRAPTASFGVTIGDTLDTVDKRVYGDLEYSHSTKHGDLVLRATADYYDYSGTYAYASTDELAPTKFSRFLDFDGAEALWFGAEARGRLKRESYGRYLRDLEIGAGGEVRDADGRQYSRDNLGGAEFEPFDRTDRADRAAVFGHASARAFNHIVGFVAGRGDYYRDSVGFVVNPQLGIVLDGGDDGRIRGTIARGHRSPNLYEHYFGAGLEGTPPPNLEAEKSETREVSVERYLGSHLRLLVVGFQQDVSNLIALTDTDDGTTVFGNVGSLSSRGVEAELEGRWEKLQLRTSFSRQHTSAGAGEKPANSPSSLANFTLVAPFAGGRGVVGVESWYVASRIAFDRAVLPPQFMTNAAVTIHHVVDQVDLTLGVTNLFDQRGGDPGSEEHRQSVIPHDPRVIWARLHLELP